MSAIADMSQYVEMDEENASPREVIEAFKGALMVAQICLMTRNTCPLDPDHPWSHGDLTHWEIAWRTIGLTAETMDLNAPGIIPAKV